MSSSSGIDDELKEHLEALWDASISKNTRLVYQTAFKCFQKFLLLSRQYKTGKKLPLIDENHLMYFVTYCQKVLNFKYQTIKLYLAGIRHFYIRLEGFDPLIKTIQLPYILRGIQKTQSNLRQERLPITSNVQQELCSTLSKGVFSYFRDIMLDCAFKWHFLVSSAVENLLADPKMIRVI